MTFARLIHGRLPRAGVALALCLFVVAAMRYPGGTTDSATSTGYDWSHNFVSSLFGATALNGAPNTARIVAIPAFALLCACIAAMFKSVSTRAATPVPRKIIEICGIGAGVYMFLVATPMHNLMINIALPCALVAIAAVLQQLLRMRKWRLFAAGAASVALLLLTALMYYTRSYVDALPLMQKLSMLACVAWLCAVHHALSSDAA